MLENVQTSTTNNYDPNPAPGTCEQIDHEFAFLDHVTGETRGPGGVCECKPPEVQIVPPTTTVASQCPSGSTVPTANISWSLGGYPAQNVIVEISTTSNFATFWTKTINSGTTSTDANGFTNKGDSLILASSTIYYVRVRLLTSNVVTSVVNFTGAACNVVVQPPTISSSCPPGNSTPIATINWTGTALNVDIDTNVNFTGGFWFKNNLTGSSTQAPTGFVPSQGETAQLVLNSTATYYVRVNYAVGGLSSVVSFTPANCIIIVVNPPTVTSTCPSGSTTPTATISWAGNLPTNIDFDDDNNFNNGYWFKNGLTGNSVQVPDGGFVPLAPKTQALTLSSNTTYYVRAFYSTGGLTSVVQFNAATCVVIAEQCIDLAENGTDPIASIAGNFIEYTAVYQNQSTSNPYPNMSIQVGPIGSTVGRDALIPANSIVRFYNYTFDAATSRHSYRFRWEAISTSGGVIPTGTYDVRILRDGLSNIVTTPVACLETITISASVLPEPLFNVVKSGSAICEADGDSRIDYTITAQNIGSVSGIIDFVEDNYDSNLTALGIQPVSINPSYGSISGNKIIWTGDVAARSYTAGQSKQFTYSVTIPATNIFTFASSGVFNQVKLQYDTTITQDNSVTFDLRTPIICSTVIIPKTGIFDDSRLLLIGIILIISGILVYRTKIGYDISERLIISLQTSGDNLITSVKPFEENIIDKMERKAEGKSQSKKRRK